MFQHRTEAAVLLAEKLRPYTGENTIVLGLARGGVIIAREIASALSVPFDVLVVKKIAHDRNPELAIGALAPDGISVIHWRAAQRMGADEMYIKELVEGLSREIDKKIKQYRGKKPPLTIRGKRVILVDDGMATGATMEAAIRWCKAKKAMKIIVGVPVSHPDTVKAITPECDVCVLLSAPADFGAVGQFYTDFAEVKDDTVIALLHQNT